jgi:hypothetical protein
MWDGLSCPSPLTLLLLLSAPSAPSAVKGFPKATTAQNPYRHALTRDL